MLAKNSQMPGRKTSTRVHLTDIGTHTHKHTEMGTSQTQAPHGELRRSRNTRDQQKRRQTRFAAGFSGFIEIKATHDIDRAI